MKMDTKAGLISVTSTHITFLQDYLPQVCTQSWLEFPVPPRVVGVLFNKHDKVKNTWKVEEKVKQ